MYKKSPCYECKERSSACHINCERYLSWKAERDKLSAEIREKKLIERGLREAEVKRRKPKIRKGNRFDIL